MHDVLEVVEDRQESGGEASCHSTWLAWSSEKAIEDLEDARICLATAQVTVWLLCVYGAFFTMRVLRDSLFSFKLT